MDLELERQRLVTRDADWAALAAEGRDIERMVSFWAEDARVYPPGGPEVRGKAALRDYVQGALAIPGFHITWTSSVPTLSPDGQMAWMVSANVITMPGPSGQLIAVKGRAVTVWHRESDGEWRCVIDIWNDEPSGAASAA